MIKVFTSDLRRNITKIVCLTAGLAIGLVLIAKIYFENTYDSFLLDSDRLYILTESIEQNGEYQEYQQVPGGAAPAFKRYLPQVESATRSTWLSGETNVRTDDSRIFSTEGIVLADSCFFDVLKRDVTGGNAAEVLATSDMCVIPRSLAERIGGDVVGKQLSAPDLWADYKATIGAVYEDFPANSRFENVVLLSMNTLPKFMHDGRDNMMGNDRYAGYVRLAEGTAPADLKPGIERLLKENVPAEALEIFNFKFGVKPVLGSYASQPGVKNMTLMLTVLAIIVLLSSGLNYLLIVVGQISTRSKQMAIRKCYGTSNSAIFMRVAIESLVYLMVSLALAVLLVFCFSDLCAELLGATPETLLSTGYVWIVEGAVLLVLFVITGIIPAWIYCRPPVAHAFRMNVSSRKAWKVAMLAVEFFASGFMLCLLVLIGRQYRMVSDLDMGFEYDDVAVLSVSSLSGKEAELIREEVKRLGCVENAAFAVHNFVEWASGNNVWTDDHHEDQVNVADMEWANPEIFDVMGIKFLQGRNFRENADSTVNEVIVEERFIDVMRDHFGVTDPDIVGKTFHITGHGPGEAYYTICGVIENLRRGGFEDEHADKRAGVIFPYNHALNHLYIRFSELTPENLRQVQDVVNRCLPGKEKYVTPYREDVERLTTGIKMFGKAVMVAGISILLIALMGLIGYTTDEVQRRSKEIAIRKVTGTSESGIVGMFSREIVKVALPSLIAGGILAFIIGRMWLSRFTDRVDMSPLTFVLSLIALLLLIMGVTAFSSLKVARGNPVNYLRDE